jgi:UDP-N-acetylglucosamine--N-acetylmuramyl-(pentapeptide) pyrophosphoryl-undecaprenol N-acetylglucosamine transferase
MPQPRLKRLFLVAGGTGGHICPAIALGEWMASKVKGLEITYVSGSRPLEREIYGSSGIDPVILPCEGSPLGTGGISSAARWVQVLKATAGMSRLVRKMKPQACVLFGGYISFPALAAGRLRGIPIAVHEQNAVAGMVTKLGVKWGAKLLTGWADCRPFARGSFVNVGTPVRRMRRLPRREAWNKLGLGEFPGGKTCLVLGGSLGSHSLAERVLDVSGREDFQGWSFLVMGTKTGDNRLSERVWGIPRRWDMETLYSLADIAVVRGGASTLSELRAWAIPALVVPWPKSRDDHQLANALVFSEGGNGLVWDEARDSVAEFVARLNGLGPAGDAGEGHPVDPGIAAEQTNQDFFREILRTLEGRDGSWTD